MPGSYPEGYSREPEVQPELPVERLGRYIEPFDSKTANWLLCKLDFRLGISLEGE
ncbi:MAG TPA: hypothetical protein VES89_13545 [Candidatus Competibacteraceae bacterium]|nr:hypothetical protein [Candidatus Competibacteraceae bacterium]